MANNKFTIDNKQSHFTTKTNENSRQNNNCQVDKQKETMFCYGFFVIRDWLDLVGRSNSFILYMRSLSPLGCDKFALVLWFVAWCGRGRHMNKPAIRNSNHYIFDHPFLSTLFVHLLLCVSRCLRSYSFFFSFQ